MTKDRERKMSAIDTTTPFDELTELRSVLTTQEIADMTGLRRETISRARPDSRFHRRTEKALADLYTVVTWMKAADVGGLDQLSAVLRRPQSSLGGLSIADLLRDGKMQEIVGLLDPTALSEEEQLENLKFDPELLAQLSQSPKDDDAAIQAKLAEDERRVAELLDKDPKLASLLPAVEARIYEIFGPGTRIGRSVVNDYEDPDARDHLYLGVRSGLSFDQEIDRLAELFEREDERLTPVQDRLTIGNL